LIKVDILEAAYYLQAKGRMVMNKSTFTGLRRSKRFWVILLIVTFESRAAEAYIDPGTTGLLSQVMYVIFYAALAVFLCGIRHIKGFMLSITDHVLRLFGKKKGRDSRPSGGTV
jgi:hypothetical protein